MLKIGRFRFKRKSVKRAQLESFIIDVTTYLCDEFSIERRSDLGKELLVAVASGVDKTNQFIDFTLDVHGDKVWRLRYDSRYGVRVVNIDSRPHPRKTLAKLYEQNRAINEQIFQRRRRIVGNPFYQ